MHHVDHVPYGVYMICQKYCTDISAQLDNNLN